MTFDTRNDIETGLNQRVAHVKDGLYGLSREVRNIVITRALEAMDYKAVPDRKMRNGDDIPF